MTLGSRLHSITAVEVPCGAGALDEGCREGPAGFRRSGEAELRSKGVALTWQRMPPTLCEATAPPLERVRRTAKWAAGITRRLATNGETFVVIGGDHSCAIGTWSGVSDALQNSGPLGLIWIDAHMDMHVPETTHSGAIHGMPVACLLGHGAPDLVSVAQAGPAIQPRHVCLVGVRSFEAEELMLAEQLGIRVIWMHEVRRRGIDAALSMARDIATNGTAGFGVSLDLDAFDPADALGVGTPEPGGIEAGIALHAWAELVRDSRCLGIEIAEYNPSRDVNGRTALLMVELMSALVPGSYG